MKCVCEYCNIIFENKRHSKFCSRNCRTKFAYHKKNTEAIMYITNRTNEEKKNIKNEYFRNKYKNDKKFREYMKNKRKEYYKKEGK